MRFEAPVKIADVLRKIERKDYVLPAIQREFVWKSSQIEALFDSLLRGYPIGSFLFWDVKPENIEKYAFFDFVTNFDQRDPHNDPACLTKGHGVTAVLDGQQRLTAFNIALRGTHAEKLPRKRWADPAAFPKKRLYLDLLALNSDAGADEPMYSFRFLTDQEAAALNSETGAHWYRVSGALTMKPGPEIQKYLNKHSLGANEAAFETLYDLIRVLQEQDTINYYLEQSDELDKVLNIFIRVNSAGTVLSYSDLLLSVATAKWKDREAREAVHDLVDDMNDIGQGFLFDHDRVLKASLVLVDLPDIKFKVDNFTLDTMLEIEKRWDAFTKALLTGVELLAAFGLSGETLSAQNVVIPVAYYLMHRNPPGNYVDAPKFHTDRERIRSWVLRSMLRAGFWTGAVDTILLRTREVIKAHGANGFPLEEIESTLTAQGKALTFADAEIEELLYTKYGHRNAFLLLTLLYPGIDVSRTYHQDHVFPRSFFTPRKLKKVGVPEDEIDNWIDWANVLPNLQLLEGARNQAKSAMLPAEWINTQVPSAQRNQYLTIHDLDPLPGDLLGFEDVWDRRYAAMEKRLRKLLT